jgi:putative protease
MGMEFPVITDRTDCRCTVFNSNILFVYESLEKIIKAGVNTLRLNITDEKPEDIYNLINMHKDIIENGEAAASSYGSLIDKIKDRGFTKGHFFRKV